MSWTIAKGPLIQWGAYVFPEGSTKLLPWRLEVEFGQRPVHGALFPLGSGLGVASLKESTLTWEYLIRCGHGDSASYVYDQRHALLAQWQTVTSDGLSGQTAELVVQKGAVSGANVSARATLIAIEDVEGSAVHDRLHLTFFIDGGLQ